MTRQIKASSMLILVLMASGCEWKQREEFVSNLRCGMTTQQARSSAQRLGVTRLLSEMRDARTERVLIKERWTYIELDFRDNRLETVRLGEHRPPTHVSMGPRRNLCTGATVGELALTIQGPPRLAGAEVFVDGRLELPLSPQANRTVIVESGHHNIMLRGRDIEDISIPINYHWSTKKAAVSVPDTELRPRR
jgi:hypothetical protein